MLAVVYVVSGALWVVTNGRAAQERGLQPGEPFLAILETLILLSTPAIVALFAALHAYAPRNRKTYSRAAFGFAVLLSGITGTIHFVQLAAVRGTTSNAVAEVFALYDPNGRLTPVLATDLLAWDFFFGFALLFASAALPGDGLRTVIRAGMILAGALCLSGVAGPMSGHLKLQYPAIAGYAFIFPFVCLLLAIFFARSKHIS